MDDDEFSGATGNVPSSVTSFFGRRSDIAEVQSLLGSSRLVTLTGAGGVGKSRLAFEVARTARASFPEGAWMVDVGVISDSAALGVAIAHALSIPDASNRPMMDRLAEYLGNRRALLIFDNCEPLVEACARAIDRLLKACPKVVILATSREVLDVPGESVFHVSPLPIPDLGQEHSTEALSSYESVKLLVDRARAIQHGFVVNDANAMEVARLTVQLEGIPLAIELAASRLRSLALAEIVERLDDRFTLLSGGNRSAFPRQRTLRALIDWSYALCTEDEQLLWARLSVFAGEFDLAAAEYVCSGEPLTAPRILDLLDRLVAQSIVQAVEGGKSARFRMLMVIKDYGWERLASAGVAEQLKSRHLEHFEALSHDIARAWYGPGQEDGLARLRIDRANLYAAIDWCVGTGQGTRAVSMVAALRYHWCADGALSEGVRRLRIVLSLEADPRDRVIALWVAAWASLLHSEVEAAELYLTECRHLAVDVGDSRSLSMVSSLFGTVEFFRGRLEAAVEHFVIASAEFSGAGDTGGQLFNDFQLAIVQLLLNDDRAVDTYQRVLAVSEKGGEKWIRSRALYVESLHAWTRGDVDVAARSARAGLDIQRGFNDHVGAAVLIELLAWVAVASGEPAHAAQLLGALRSIWGAIGSSFSALGPHLARYHSECLAALERELSADALSRLFEEGARMDRKQAIGRALAGPRRASAREPIRGAKVLTKREQQVALLVTQGLSNRQIAERLVLSTRTVDGHVERILARLGFASRSQIAVWVATEQRFATG